MAVTATQVTFDTPAADFRLRATDGETYALDDVVGARALSSPSSATIALTLKR